MKRKKKGVGRSRSRDDDYKRMPVWKNACGACGARNVPLYNVVGLALCERCRKHYGPTLEDEYRRGY